MEDLPNIRESSDQSVDFDKLAFDIITGKSEDEIAAQLMDQGVESVHEKITWFTKGLLCSRKLLVKKDRSWYSKSVKQKISRLEGNEKLQKLFTFNILREVFLCFTGFFLAFGLIFISSLLTSTKYGIILEPMVQVLGGLLFFISLSYLIWTFQTWWRSKK
ncbi:MAG: hypothetical protein PVI26_11000 [Chitinispirillia bacterium]|jgi:hypothetical protein